MAWIELHQAVWTHRKTLLLAADLALDETYAAAHLARLWTWALDNAPDGTLTGLPSRVIAYSASWKGDPDHFVASLVRAGWLDRDGETLVIHDWLDYAGRLIERRQVNTERMRQARARHVRDTCATCAGATVPNRTQPNPTQPYPTVPAAAGACAHVSRTDPAGIEATTAATAALSLYEQAKGRLTDVDRRQVEQLIQTYTGEWVTAAVEEAVASGAHSLGTKLLGAICQRWQKDGFRAPRQPRQKEGNHAINRGDSQGHGQGEEDRYAYDRELLRRRGETPPDP